MAHQILAVQTNNQPTVVSIEAVIWRNDEDGKMGMSTRATMAQWMLDHPKKTVYVREASGAVFRVAVFKIANDLYLYAGDAKANEPLLRLPRFK
jgi:hypothetical protein